MGTSVCTSELTVVQRKDQKEEERGRVPRDWHRSDFDDVFGVAVRPSPSGRPFRDFGPGGTLGTFFSRSRRDTPTSRTIRDGLRRCTWTDGTPCVVSESARGVCRSSCGEKGLLWMSRVTETSPSSISRERGRVTVIVSGGFAPV